MYSSGMGMMGPVYMFASSGKDRADWEAKSKESKELMGEARGEIVKEDLELVYKIENVEGWVREDLSYEAKPETTAESASSENEDKE